MINSSLDVYKIEQGNYPVTPVKVDILRIVNNAIKGTSLLAEQKSIHVKVIEQGNNFWADAEEMLCVAILNNIIKNAIEASPDNATVSITLSLESNFVNVSTLNQGAVPLELRDNLFEKFSSSNHIKGSGFGTYSAKIMTEVQGGQIGFEILNESHTLFTMRLPITA